MVRLLLMEFVVVSPLSNCVLFSTQTKQQAKTMAMAARSAQNVGGPTNNQIQMGNFSSYPFPGAPDSCKYSTAIKNCLSGLLLSRCVGTAGTSGTTTLFTSKGEEQHPHLFATVPARDAGLLSSDHPGYSAVILHHSQFSMVVVDDTAMAPTPNVATAMFMH